MKKPALTGSSRFRQGVFKLQNPKKYVGDPNQVFFRSNLEKRFMKIFDEQPAILNWASEEMVIEYFSKLDQKVRRYFPDFVLKIIDKNDNVRTLIVEIKPKSQTIPPQSKGKKRYITEMMAWQVNSDKWQHADAYCRKKGYEFWVLTEDHLKRGF